jgi:hypothetical protein
VFSRAEGHSAVAAAAYRAGAILHDERAGHTHHYQRRKGVALSFIVAPATAPENTYDRAHLWNAAELAENRKNSRVAREIILALPHELSEEQRSSLTRDMALWLVERYRVAVDGAIHAPVIEDGHDTRNHHAHLLFTTREITKDGLGAKTRVLDDKEKGPQEIEVIRLVWETLANDALSKAGFEDIRINRRTLDDQGIDRIPQIHIGPEGKAVYEKKSSSEEDNSSQSDDDDDKGEDEQGSSGSSNSSSIAPKTAEAQAEPEQVSLEDRQLKSETPKESLKPIPDQKSFNALSRYEQVIEIKKVNADRDRYSPIPLKDQIRALEDEMIKLDKRVNRLEDVYSKANLPTLIKDAIKSIIKLSAELITFRADIKEQLKSIEARKLSRSLKQGFKYHKEYKQNIYERISETKQKLVILDTMSEQVKRYDKFVSSIEKSLAQDLPYNFKEASAIKTHKLITNQEAGLKVKLKADLIREYVPNKFKPVLSDYKLSMANCFNDKSIPSEYRAKYNSQEIAINKPSLEEKAKRKNWYSPATPESIKLQKYIDDQLSSRTKDIALAIDTGVISKTFNAEVKAIKYADNEAVISKVKSEALGKIPQIPIDHSAEVNIEVSKSNLSNSFNKASQSVNKNDQKTKKYDCPHDNVSLM